MFLPRVRPVHLWQQDRQLARGVQAPERFRAARFPALLRALDAEGKVGNHARPPPWGRQSDPGVGENAAVARAGGSPAGVDASYSSRGCPGIEQASSQATRI